MPEPAITTRHPWAPLTPEERLTPAQRFIHNWLADVTPEDRITLAPCVHCCELVPRNATACECGLDPKATWMVCPDCGGEGQYDVWVHVPWNTKPRECRTCDGYGKAEPPCALERETWIRATEKGTA